MPPYTSHLSIHIQQTINNFFSFFFSLLDVFVVPVVKLLHLAWNEPLVVPCVFVDSLVHAVLYYVEATELVRPP